MLGSSFVSTRYRLALEFDTLFEIRSTLRKAKQGRQNTRLLSLHGREGKVKRKWEGTDK